MVRRIYLRASNGRVCPYDLNCAQLAFHTSPPGLHQVVPDHGSFFSLCRVSKTDQLAHLVNDLLSREPSTAKRRLCLTKPKFQQIGPSGVCVSKSSSTTTSTMTAFALASGSLPVAGHTLSPDTGCWMSQPVATSSITIPKFDFENLSTTSTENVTVPRQNALNPNGNVVGGSTAVSLDAQGRPTAFQCGIYSTAFNLLSIVNQCLISHSLPDVQSISLTHLKDYLSVVLSSDRESKLITAFERALDGLPDGPRIQSPSAKVLHSLMHGMNYHLGLSESSKLLRNWAVSRLEDCESYWLFRRGMATHTAVNILCGQVLFNQTPLAPSQLVIDLRSAVLQHIGTHFLGPTSGDSPMAFSSPAYAQLFATVMGYEQWSPAATELDLDTLVADLSKFLSLLHYPDYGPASSRKRSSVFQNIPDLTGS
ncbi:hypothetical protein Ciccas_002785 [Cichlidogyrus casuarinus]|uniref:Uncharacterized protein n=1 Tax=Cichlidogyrus casuarinus TaxID=1844966 RepID=A0ABD2QG87_9PLAT